MKLNWLAVLAGGSVFFLVTFLTRALGLLVVGDAGGIALPVIVLIAGIAAGFAAGALAGRAGLLHGALAASPWTLVAGLTALITWALIGQAPSPSPGFWTLLVFGPFRGSLGGELGVRIAEGRVVLRDVMPPGGVLKRPVRQLFLLFGAMALTYVAIACLGFRLAGLGVGILGLGYGAYLGWRLRGRAVTAQKLGIAFFMLMGTVLVLVAWLGEMSSQLSGPALWGSLFGLATGGILAGFLLRRYAK